MQDHRALGGGNTDASRGPAGDGKRRLRAFAALLAAAYLFGTSQASAQALPPQVAPQIDPGLINRQNQRNENQILEQARPPNLGPAVLTGPTKPSAIAAPGGPTFVLKAVSFDPSAFITRQDLDAIAAPYIGRRVDIATVQRIVKAVNDIYAERKIATAAAYLPPQDLKSGVLRVGIVEGKLGKVDVKNNSALSADYLRGRIGETPGQVIDPDGLGDRVARFNKTGVAQVQAFLQPGAQFGLTDIQLGVLEPPTNALQLFLDNQGVRSVGRSEGGFLFQRYAPLGFDDKFLAYLVRSGGDLAGNFGYNMPVGDSGGRVGASFSRGHITIINGPFAPLKVEGDSTTSAFNASQPLFVKQRWLVLALGSVSYSRSTSTQSKIAVTDNDTLKGTAGVTLGYTGDAFAASVSPAFSRAQTQFNVTERGLDFDLASGTYAASYRLPESFLVTLGGAFQVASRDLLPGDGLFQIGGPTTVRGYPTDGLAGPSGYFGNLELHQNLAPVGAWLDAGSYLDTIDAYAFYDRGAVYNPSPKAVTLNSLGLGLSDSVTKNLLAEVSAGFPINSAIEHQSSYEVYFRLTAKLD